MDDESLNRFRLEATVLPKHTVHTTYKLNRQHGPLREPVETTWTQQKKNIGHGAFGQVHLESCVKKDSLGREISQLRAVKKIFKNQMLARNIDYKRELAALVRLSIPEYKEQQIFVDFHGWFETPEALFIAMEYFELGDLSRYVGEDITELDAVEVANDLLFGLKIMHSEGFTHRDLKPQSLPPKSGSKLGRLYRTYSFGKNGHSRPTGASLSETLVSPNE
ncbi:hypothetical protein H2199_002465 [Coniosporium tulheliwenetii]|uniref:Uncharacterized protein n=1 Tax=Coniosporium tulheliwenetii TaxID=3383036 RepID=A0ACC2ZGL4_9PEZI|nr:hypothetical protein H2199_002465 [Cladosporium sp. JES 115]